MLYQLLLTLHRPLTTPLSLLPFQVTSLLTQYGPYLAGGLIAFLAIYWLVLRGDDDTTDLDLEKQARTIRQSTTNGTVNEDALQSENDDVVTEALNRLKMSSKQTTGQNLMSELENLEEDMDSDTTAQTPLVQDTDERHLADTLAVAPETFEEHESYLKRNGKYVRELVIADYPGQVSAGWLDRLFTSSVNVRVSYHIMPRDPDSMQRRLDIRAARVMSQLREKERKNKMDTTEEESALEQINRLREELAEGATSVFDFSLYLEVIADTEEELENATGEITYILEQTNARVVPLYDRQKEAQTSVAPLAKDRARNTQVMDTEALGTTFPFIEPSVVHPEGVLLGFHRITNTPVVVDRFGGETSGNNMLISGKIGSGKSYFAKLETWRRLMMDPEVEVLIIDPVGGETGFTDLVNGLDGQRITVDGRTTINPMEIRSSGETEQMDAYEQKLESVLGMFKSSFRNGELTKQEEGILLRAIRFAYLRKGITSDPTTHDNTNPVVQDVLDILKEMAQGKNPREFLDVPPEVENYISAIEMETNAPDAATDEVEENEFIQRNREKEATYAQNVFLGLEDFQEGGQNDYLNGETSVDIHARVVQFDVSGAVDKGSAPLLMHVVLDWLFQRTKGTPKRNQVVIDEAHYMLGQSHALDMLELFARHSRHYNSALTLISQTVAEFIQNEQAKAIYDQCDVRALMRHEDLGEDETDALGLTSRQRQFVLQAQAGRAADYSECLLYVSDVGHLRIQVVSNDFEHNVIDDEYDAWAFLYEADMVEWPAIPSQKQEQAWPYLSEEAQRQIATEHGRPTPA